MRKDAPIDWVRVECLDEIDSLVGRYITGEEPEIHWEDSHAHMRFDSAEEALDAMREPYFQQFIPASVRAETVLKEVQEFSPYCSDLAMAWQVVEKLANPKQPMRLWQERGSWCAAFGEFLPVTAQTAPLAICLAALRLRGLEIALNDGPDRWDAGASAA